MENRERENSRPEKYYKDKRFYQGIGLGAVLTFFAFAYTHLYKEGYKKS